MPLAANSPCNDNQLSMKSEISKLIERMEARKREFSESLSKSYADLAEKYGFSISGRKIVFVDKARKTHKKLRENVFKYVLTANVRNVLSMPFIYSMIIPAVILDIFITTYQFFAFPLYGIPRAKRSDFIVYDRRFLAYLNVIEKIHCLYCSYVNGLFAYSMEIAARTEWYWCPIKAAKSPHFSHSQYQRFADYGDAEGWKDSYHNNERCFIGGESCEKTEES